MEYSKIKIYWAQWDSLILQAIILKRKWESLNGKSIRYQIVLLKELINEVSSEFYEDAFGGHLDIKKVLEKIHKLHYWVKQRKYVETWCRKCNICTMVKGLVTRNKGKTQQYNVGAPFERIAVDVASPFPQTDNGNNFVMVMMDYFTKWPVAVTITKSRIVDSSDTIV